MLLVFVICSISCIRSPNLVGRSRAGSVDYQKIPVEFLFQGTNVKIETRTSVYLPPHLMNLTTKTAAYRWLRFFDKLAQATPFLKDNGGRLRIRRQKQKPA